MKKRKLSRFRMLFRRERTELKLLKEDLRQHSLLITALYLWILFLTYEVFIRTYNLYRTLPDVDLGGHFLAGLAICASFYWIAIRRNILHTHWFSFFGTLIIALCWEVVEEIQEFFVYNPPYLRDIFIWDGLIDVFISLVAAATYLLVKTFSEKSHNNA